MADTLELDALWEEFHRLVNMTSAELSAWLKTEDAHEDTEPLPDQAGSPTGQHVLGILQKRRVDLTEADVEVMRRVVDTLESQTDLEKEPQAYGTERRHRLMSLGHDPLKPSAKTSPGASA
ncbi:DUF3140 domain-containing protein [Streptomyces minutiscleroticus]|uniref:DUF3140 domain-containing protein n=1 Tax=Streptomyces minutiscleroticus TaxID=68238 RepID=A0A918NQB5_9ACTN|nr:DUF3140 domain-containing protein [Streptomyces minutiscleroticus]GGX86846.1 hypothetical protein GCM10010358_46120 [Streptomyces minutiscleroticus]